MNERQTNSNSIQASLSFIALLIILASFNIGFSQGNPHLIAEKQTSHQQVELVAGRQVLYKALASQHFEKVWISGFTDSTISFENKKIGNVTIPFRDLATLKSSKKTGRVIAKTMLILSGVGLILLSAGESIAGGNDASGSWGGLGAVAIVSGIAIPARQTIDLKKSWTLKTSRILAQDTSSKYSNFKVGIGLGYAGQVDQSKPNSGVVFYLEPMYNLSSDLAIGARLESFAGSDNINSIALDAQYYLNHGNIRAFIGAGFGYYSVKLSSASVASTNLQAGDLFQTTGFYPRIGADFNRFSLTLDYNLLPPQTVDVNHFFPGSPGFWATYPSSRKYTYLGVKVGYFIGGGRK